MTLCAFPSEATAEQRTLPAAPDVETLCINFNDEDIKGYVLLIDARTAQEKATDARQGHPAGPILVFFQGHAQRPDDAYEFTSNLAGLCRSGIVVVPVCDTPYGSDPLLYGDSGKDVILMDMVRFVLGRQGISVKDFTPISSKPVTVNGTKGDAGKDAAGTELVPIGWSHGGILARRFSHAYPGSVHSLGQVCPAGYEHWGPWGLTGRFALESLRIFARMGNGHAGQMMRSSWGFTKGFTGDFLRSLPGALIELHPAKAGRVFRDIRECSAYCDSSTFKVSHLDRAAVIFGADDSCMDPARQLGIEDTSRVTPDEELRFRQTFFADLPGTARLSLKILPGTHLAPVTHYELYARTLLADLSELAGH